jgi:phosphatidylglycerophosphate synthase
MKITKADILSPANAISAIGLSLTIWGSFNIHTLAGVLVLGAGRFIDLFDGKVARATHTSRFGAAVDATFDKIGLAFLVPAIWIAHIAPYWLLIYILAQNILNVIFSVLASARNAKPTSSKFGKHAMFLQQISLGFYALGNTLDFRPFTIVGLIIGIGSIYWAVQATYGYFKLVPERPYKEKK